MNALVIGAVIVNFAANSLVARAAQTAPGDTPSGQPLPVPGDAAAPARPDLPVLTLERAVEAALKNQPSLHQARASTEAAAGREDQARAGALPQLNGVATYQRTTGNFSPRPGATSASIQAAPPWSTRTYDFFNFGLSASQLIYDFGQTPGRRRSAEANREAAEAAERTAAFNVALAVRRAFFQARAQKALIAVAGAGVSNQERHVQQIKSFVAAGLRPEIDLARVRTDLANARFQLITAENGYALAKAQLAQAMGAEAPRQFEVADQDLPAVEGEAAPAESLLEDALTRRPELSTLERQRLAQTHLVSSLKGGYGPALSATAGATETGTSLGTLVPNWVVGATLAWPILQGGLTKGQVREANANVRVIDAQIDAFRLQVRVEIEQALLSIRAAQASILAAEDALSSGREQLRLAEGRYRTGLGNAIELSDAQVAFTTAGALAVQARFELAAARAELLTALGRR
jgi:outer membrane protein